ncbi:hypothetical protein ACQP2P_17665 [Dactylosporangium sp. CA-139114]|uniref:hypothetical protein n=1 Tax=Dactylosporangium sp. CA-139114 TaxID=3239931 RepID=UPI003D971970
MRVARVDDVQVGSYTYRVLRPARPIRGAVVTPDGELRASRRDALRMLALASLAADRTLAALPLRDERGLPFDLVLNSLPFPVSRWSDVRARLGPGRLTLLAPAPQRTASGSKPRLESTRHALLAPLADVPRVRAGELDLATFGSS